MRQKIHTIIYLLTLCLIAVGMTTSVFLMNLGWVLLLANWAAEWDMKRKWMCLRDNRLLQAFLFLVALHLVALLWSNNLDYGLNDIRKKLPLLVVPLVMLTSRPLNKSQLNIVLFCYVGAIIVASVVGLVRYFTIPDLPYRQIIPFISHIRFTLNLCLAIALLSRRGVLSIKDFRQKGGAKTMRSIMPIVTYTVLVLYFLGYMFLLQSYTGVVILLILGIVLFSVYWNHISNARIRGRLLAIIVLLVVAVSGITVYYINDYYHLRPLSAQPLQKSTLIGNPYHHECDGFVENGNYVNNYICDTELYAQWSKISAVHLDSLDSNGYAVRLSLIRYLNAKGLTKDSVGVAQLSPDDVEAIEKGYANPVYLHKLSLKRMFDVMLYEYESYRCYNSVCDFTMLQRFELWRAGWQVYCQHPLFGTGTGDVEDECHAQLKDDQSPLAGTTMHTHNQYLTLLITFGAVGLLLILLAFGAALRHHKLLHQFFFLVVFVIVMVSFISEDTLETLAGCMFVAFFFSLFAQPLGELDASNTNFFKTLIPQFYYPTNKN